MRGSSWSSSVALLMLLWLSVIGSATAVVQTSHQCRQLYARLTDLEREKNTLQVAWGRYLLEEGSWTSLNRVEKEATARLGMRIPEIDEMVMVSQ